MRAVIIDDMPLAIASLKADIEDHLPEIELLGTAESVVSGAKLIKKEKPELVFLDIEMPDGLGFDLIDLLDEPYPNIIFVTASNEYAIKAFRYAAIDYLLKPAEPELLIEAYKKAKQKSGMSNEQLSLAKNSFSENSSNQLALNTQDELRIVDIKDIVRCEADSNYTTFYFNDNTKMIVTKSLKEYDKTLSPSGFIRSHQSHLVNAEYIDSLQKADGGYLLLKDKQMVPVSVRKRSEVLEYLKNRK